MEKKPTQYVSTNDHYASELFVDGLGLEVRERGGATGTTKSVVLPSVT